MIAEDAIDDDRIAGTDLPGADVNTRGNDTDARGGDEHAIALAPFDDLGIPCHDADAGAIRLLPPSRLRSAGEGRSRSLPHDERAESQSGRAPPMAGR